jgi:acetoin utilization deacetylase AcuC-like enzyme
MSSNRPTSIAARLGRMGRLIDGAATAGPRGLLSKLTAAASPPPIHHAMQCTAAGWPRTAQSAMAMARLASKTGDFPWCWCG